MKKERNYLIFSAILTLAVVISGCSNQNPTSSSGILTATPELAAVAGEPVEFAARVRTTSQDMLMLTFHERADTVIAAQNCRIIRFKNETEAPIPFSDIMPGDSVNVMGIRQQNGYAYVHRIMLCNEWNAEFDMAFRDTISTIDYQAGIITVRNHSQAILVDENTAILGVVIRHYSRVQQGQEEQTAGSSTAKVGPGYGMVGNDTVLTIADLNVDDVIEVRANIIDSATVLAVLIRVAPSNDKVCVEFTDFLAAVDTDAGLVTFQEQPWIGSICKGARLVGLDGEPLTLADFSSGDYVTVKGFPLTDDTLKVCQMVKVPY